MANIERRDWLYRRRTVFVFSSSTSGSVNYLLIFSFFLSIYPFTLSPIYSSFIPNIYTLFIFSPILLPFLIYIHPSSHPFPLTSIYSLFHPFSYLFIISPFLLFIHYFTLSHIYSLFHTFSYLFIISPFSYLFIISPFLLFIYHFTLSPIYLPFHPFSYLFVISPFLLFIYPNLLPFLLVQPKFEK